MNIDVYVVCWNEEVIMPHFLEHYFFANRITVYDNESTDGTGSIASNNPKTRVITFNTDNQFNDLQILQIKNNAWKDSRGKADYVIVCDADEFLYHHELIDYLESAKERGVTIFRPRGFNVVTDFPPAASDHMKSFCKYGARSVQMDKCVIFDPNAIEEINYSPGAHDCNPQGKVVMETSCNLKLLHMKYLGPEYLLQRHAQYKNRLSEVNRKNNWGNHYLFQETDLLTDFQKTKDEATHEIYLGLRVNKENVNTMFMSVCESISGSGYKLDTNCVEIFEEILEVQPRHLSALNNISVALFVMRRNKEAGEYIRKLLSLQPNHLHGLFNFCQMLSEFGMHAESEMFYNQLLSVLRPISTESNELLEVFTAARKKPHCLLLELPVPMFVDFN